MIQYTLKIDGMMCGMCESHVNDAVRKALPQAKKVSSSHLKKRTTFVTENPIDENALRAAVDATGYTVLEIICAPYEKKGLLFFFKKRSER